MRRRIGLLGGTFNPIHLGHLAMARAAREEMALDEVILMPDGDPPHKEPEGAGRADRLCMTELAAEGLFPVSHMEADRPGKTYTVDTLEALRAQGAEDICMIIGADTLRELLTWRDPARVFALCRFAAFGRRGCEWTDVPGARVTRLETDIPDISSTAIRERVRRGLSIGALVPPKVEEYIGLHRLYGPPRLLAPEEMRARLRATLHPGRFLHVEGVEQTVKRLARFYGYDEDRAGLAGLLHDCAKGMSLEEMRACAAKYEVTYDALRGESAALLHAPVGEAVARAEYGVTDPAVLRAIRVHNTGCEAMGTLDKLLYISDMIEPSRRSYPGLEALRAEAETGLDRAVILCMRHKLAYVRERGQTLHPDTERALRDLEARLDEGTRNEINAIEIE